MERWDDDAFIQVMSEVIPGKEMTHELAAQEAITFHVTSPFASGTTFSHGAIQ